MDAFQFPDAKDEEELYRTRLLNIEEKPFKRITKRIATLHNLATAQLRQQPTPPPESEPGTAAPDAADGPAAPAADELALLREDVSMDFAAFDATIARLQLLFAANERERARYAAARVGILQTCQQVRDQTTALRARLTGARATLAQRRQFDELAERIASNRLLRPRADQQASLRKLEDECAQLEAESDTYAATWRERRDQFARIMDESMRLRRLIRDEKEEVERREGMDDGEAGGPDGGDTPRPGVASGHATPLPDSGMLPKAPGAGGLEAGDAATPRPASTFGGRTPARESPGPDGDGLKPRPGLSGSFSQNASRAPSRDVSPSRAGASQRDEPEEGEDVEMDDSARPSGTPVDGTQGTETPRITVNTQETVDAMDTT